MRVFVTGASGFTGQAVVKELLQNGHQVVGLARSDASAKIISDMGAEVHRGSIEDLNSLKQAAAAADGVIHLAFIHDFTDYVGNCQKDREVILAIGEALEGSNRPFIMTSGTFMCTHGRVGTETDAADETQPFSGVRAKSEGVLLSLASKGVRGLVVRISPTNHGENDHGFIAMLCGVAQKTGESAYIGDGLTRWAAVHRLDTARIFRLALEKGKAGSIYHAVAEGEITIKDIASAIGERLGVPVTSKTPEEAPAHFGFVAGPLSIDNPMSNVITQQELGWTPEHPGLLADIKSGIYFKE